MYIYLCIHLLRRTFAVSSPPYLFLLSQVLLLLLLLLLVLHKLVACVLTPQETAAGPLRSSNSSNSSRISSLGRATDEAPLL